MLPWFLFLFSGPRRSARRSREEIHGYCAGVRNFERRRNARQVRHELEYNIGQEYWEIRRVKMLCLSYPFAMFAASWSMTYGKCFCPAAVDASLFARAVPTFSSFVVVLLCDLFRSLQSGMTVAKTCWIRMARVGRGKAQACTTCATAGSTSTFTSATSH